MAFRLVLVVVFGFWVVVTAAAQDQVGDGSVDPAAGQLTPSDVATTCVTPDSASDGTSLDATVPALDPVLAPITEPSEDDGSADAASVPSAPDLTVQAQSLVRAPDQDQVDTSGDAAAPVDAGEQVGDASPADPVAATDGSAGPPDGIVDGGDHLADPVCTPTPTPSPTATSTLVPTATATPPVMDAPPTDVTATVDTTASPTPSLTEAVTLGPTWIPTQTPTPRITLTATPTITSTPMPTTIFTNSGGGLFGGGGGGGSSSGGSAAPTPASGPVSGIWSGTTSQGKAINFTIDGANVKAVTFGYSTSGCAPTEGQSVNQFSGNEVQIIAGTSFSMRPALTGSNGLTNLEARFSSSTSATGTITLYLSSGATLDNLNALPCGSNAAVTFSATAPH